MHIAEIEISNVKIAFEIVREADDTPPNGEIVIWNLARDTEARIFERGENIQLDAGYPETIATVYQGRAEKILRERAGHARTTKINLTGTATPTGKQFAGISVINPSEQPHNVRDLAARLVTDMGLELGPLDAIPADATISGDFSYSGPSYSGLKSILLRIDVTLYEDDGVIRFNKNGSAQVDSVVLVLTPETGLVGSPAVTEDGVRCKSFLQPLARIGAVVDLTSENVTGLYKVVALVHRGNNWDGEFITEYDLREIERPVQETDINQIDVPGATVDPNLSAFLRL